MKYKLIYIPLFLLTVTFSSFAEITPSPQEMEQWFDSDDELSTDHVNEGELKFLQKPPLKPSLHSINRISISQQSITTGWVLLEQCYEHMDPVPISEIVYQYKTMRSLRITSQQNIESASIANKTIQLENVNKNAKLCIKAEVKILNKQNDNSYSLINGPFHRQFLHGYYPYHLSLQINYPSSMLKLASISPENQKGFVVIKKLDFLNIESHFEGRLTIKLIFELIVAYT